jgi:isopentenyl-diphosphate delta-isomerase
LTIIGSGGIRDGIDIAKALTLGADLVGIARPLLEPATKSAAAVEEKLRELIFQLKVAMFCTGSKNIKQLKRARLERV